MINKDKGLKLAQWEMMNACMCACKYTRSIRACMHARQLQHMLAKGDHANTEMLRDEVKDHG